jgi:hypothetical protein
MAAEQEFMLNVCYMDCASDKYICSGSFFTSIAFSYAYCRYSLQYPVPSESEISVFNSKLIQLDRGRIQWSCRMPEQRMQRREDQDRQGRSASWHLG